MPVLIYRTARCLKVKCTVQGKQARVKNADLRHPSCTVVM